MLLWKKLTKEFLKRCPMHRMVLIILLTVVFSSCTKDQFKAEIPSYIHIESIDLETDSFEGSDSQNLTDAWVTMDGNFLGAFELPCTIPILADGAHEFRVSSGIKANGISATRIIYPFFEICDLFIKDGDTYQVSNSNIVNLHRDSMVVLKATTSYKENVAFLFVEDFEDAGTVVETTENSDTSLIRTNIDSLVFEGYGSGEIHLDSNNDFFERQILIQCAKGNLGLAIQNSIFFSISDYLDVKMRFDKNPPLEFSFIHNDNIVGTIDKDTVSNFLNSAKTANNLVVKIEDNDHIMRFTNFEKDQNKIIQFIERVQSKPGCGNI